MGGDGSGAESGAAEADGARRDALTVTMDVESGAADGARIASAANEPRALDGAGFVVNRKT